MLYASPTKSSFSDSIRYLEQYAPLQPNVFGAPDYSAGEVNLTKHLAKRDVPPEGTAPDRDDFYRNLNAVKMNIYDSAFGATAVMAGIPKGQDIQVMMQGLSGCLAIFVVSHNGTYPHTPPQLHLRLQLCVELKTKSLTLEIGFFMSHSWQKQALVDSTQTNLVFQSDVIDLLAYVALPIMATRSFTKIDRSSNLLGQGSDSALYGDARVFVMAATAGSVNSLDADPSSLFNSQSSHAYPEKIDKVLTLLKAKFKQDPEVFNYLRQRADNPDSKGAWGKAAVSLICIVTGYLVNSLICTNTLVFTDGLLSRSLRLCDLAGLPAGQEVRDDVSQHRATDLAREWCWRFTWVRFHQCYQDGQSWHLSRRLQG